MQKQISKSQLAEFYKNNTNRDTARWLGVSVPTLISYIKTLNIPGKGKGNRQPKSLIKFVD